MEEKIQKGGFFVWLMIHQMHEPALQLMHWQCQIEGAGPASTAV